MNRIAVAFLSMAVGVGLNFSTARAGDDAKPDGGAKPDGAKPDGAKADGGDRPRRERFGGGDRGGDRAGNNNAGDRGAGGRGQWGGGGQGGPGGPGGFLGGLMGGQRNNIIGMASRMLGFDIEDPKANTGKVEALPLGAEKRMVVSVPVGGVDNFSGTGQGWKVETVFKMTDEQTKAVDALREEYKAEQKKLEAEIHEQQKAMAEKVKLLRAKYEQRANDVLTGDDKTAKEKMDALAKETNTKNAQVVTDLLPMFDQNDMAQGFAMLRTINEKTSTNIKAAEEKLVELVPADNRARIQEVMKTQNDLRERNNRFMQFGGGPGGGGGPGARGRAAGGKDGEPQKPPAPPEQDKKENF